MKSQQNLTSAEKQTMMSDCLRDMMSVPVTDRRIPNLVNRGRAVAMLVTTMQRETILHNRIEKANLYVEAAQTKGLKKKN